MAENLVDWVEVGKRLRRIRKEKGLSQREFGQHFAVSQNMISLYEKGRSQATVEFYLRAAQFGERTIEWLLLGHQDATLETLREMQDLHDKVEGHLDVVRQLLNRETDSVFDRMVTPIEDPEQLRAVLTGEKGLPGGLQEALADPALWRSLALTGREVCALLFLAREFGDLSLEGLRSFLLVVRRAGKDNFTVAAPARPPRWQPPRESLGHTI